MQGYGLDLHTLEVQNFRSFGAKVTTIDFRQLDGVTVITGENLDLQDKESANGCGKSALFVDALAYGFTGEPVKKVDSNLQLVNDVNEKEAYVAIQGTHKGELFRIERRLKPSKLHFYRRPINAAGDIKSFDVTKDAIRRTEADILEFFGFDIDIFKLVLVTATKTEAFFGMKTDTQKSVIETLFGLELLSKKAAAINEDRKALETAFKVEDSKITERKASRERTQRRLDEVKSSATKWLEDLKNDLARIDEEIVALAAIDFDAERSLWDEITTARSALVGLEKNRTERSQAVRSAGDVVSGLEAKQRRSAGEVEELRKTDFEGLLKSFDDYDAAQRDIALLKTEHTRLVTEGRTHIADEMRASQDIEAALHRIEDLKGNCPTCGQQWPDVASRETQIKQTEALVAQLERTRKAISLRRNETETALSEVAAAIADLQKTPAPPTTFKSRDDALTASATFDQKQKVLKDIVDELNEAKRQQDHAHANSRDAETEYEQCREKVTALLEKSAFKDFVEIEFTAKHLAALRTEKASKIAAENPHSTLLSSLELELAEPVDGAELDRLDSEIRHHKYLEKALGRKDSELRRFITSDWLPKLNEYLTVYLDKLGLPYRVIFQDDLSAVIYNFEKKKSYQDLSSGEEERVIMAVSLAFREVFEQLHFPINFFIIDERLDVGLDGAGRTRCVNTLREVSLTGRKVLMITHREEMKAAADRIITVTKKGGFSSIAISKDSTREAA